MTMTDPIADMFTRIRNGYKAKHIRVDVPSSNMKKEIARILLESKLINNYREIPDQQQNILRIYLRYVQEQPALMGLRRVSKPGRRIYRQAEQIGRVRNGLGMAIISTSRGLVTDREARQNHIGGEVLAHVW